MSRVGCANTRPGMTPGLVSLTIGVSPTDGGGIIMADPIELTGLTNGAADPENQELHFTFTDRQYLTYEFSAKASVAEQIISALARMNRELRSAAIKGDIIRSASAENVAAAHVQRERLHDVVLLQLITPEDVPYTFALGREAAADISARLKSESEKDVPKGRA